MKYIGIDIGKKNNAACVKTESGKIVLETTFPNTIKDIKSFVKRLGKGQYKAVCESTGNMWLKTFKVFEESGIPIVLANPFKVKAIAYAKVKTDKVDARILADLLRADLVPTCHVASIKIRLQKEFLRRRHSLVVIRTKVSNMLGSLLDKYDIVLPTPHINSKTNLKTLKALKLDNSDDYLVQQSVRHIEYLNREIDMIEKKIREITTTNEDAKLIMTIPGFDALNALHLSLEMDGIVRFPNFPNLVSWMGLCQSVHQSGNTTYYGKMRKDTNRQVNSVMVLAALTAIRTDDRMRHIYEKAKKNHPPMVAIIHVANKLGKIIWFMLKDKKPYDNYNKSLYARKMQKLKT